MKGRYSHEVVNKIQKLSIKDLRPEDHGRYTCRYDNLESTADLWVEGLYRLNHIIIGCCCISHHVVEWRRSPQTNLFFSSSLILSLIFKCFFSLFFSFLHFWFDILFFFLELSDNICSTFLHLLVLELCHEPTFLCLSFLSFDFLSLLSSYWIIHHDLLNTSNRISILHCPIWLEFAHLSLNYENNQKYSNWTKFITTCYLF